MCLDLCTLFLPCLRFASLRCGSQVIGRDEEIKRAIQVLSRRTKNNACLVGGGVLVFTVVVLWLWAHRLLLSLWRTDPGVGKTAIAGKALIQHSTRYTRCDFAV